MKLVFRLAGAFLLLLLTSCFNNTNSNLTESGEGKPLVSIAFPPSVEPDVDEVATMTIENPGPGDMDSVLVTFAILGRSDLPDALVGFGQNGKNPSITAVEPKPVDVSIDGVVYRFDGIPEGEEMTIEFTIHTPVEPGVYANSVTASDGTDLDRAKGLPLETRVEG